MKKRSFSAAIICTLLSSSALAGDIVIDISTEPGSNTITPVESNPYVDEVMNNSGAVTATNGGQLTGTPATRDPDDYSLDLGIATGATGEVSNNYLRSEAFANVGVNHFGYDDSNSGGVAETLMGVTQHNSGTVDSSTAIIDMQIVAGAVTGDSVLKIGNNKVESVALVNHHEINVSGDASALTSAGAAGSASVTADTSVNASGDIAIALSQKNTSKGTTTSSVDDINGYIDIASLGSAATDVSTTAILGNEIVSAIEINTANNIVALEHSGLELSIAIAVSQDNDADAAGSISNANFSQTVGGASFGNMTTANNDFTSSTSANRMTNQINSESGGADGNIGMALLQDNSGDLSNSVSGVNLSMTAGTTASTDTLNGDLSIQNNSVGSTATGNTLSNQVEFAGNAGGTAYSSGLTSVQNNSGDLTASVTGVNMSANVTGTTASHVSVSNNTVISSAVANSVTNIIRMR